MHVLDFHHCRVIHQDTDCQRETAEGHQIDRLTGARGEAQRRE